MNLLDEVDIGYVIVVQSIFLRERFRGGFDLIVPPILRPPDGDIWPDCAHEFPA